MKRKVLGVLAIVIAVSASAFTTKKANSNFYLYTGGTTQADVQNISNYSSIATDPCGGSTNVCGVTLSTSRPTGQQPVATEFNAEKANLWSSQQSHAAADGSIEMKN